MQVGFACALLVALVTMAPRTALAQKTAADDALEVNYAVDGAITAISGVSYLVVALVFKGDVAPEACRWCADNGFDAGVRESLVWEDTSAARTWSNVTAYGVGAASAFGLGFFAAYQSGARELWAEDALLVLEAVALQASLNQLVKMSVGRERPFVHALDEADKSATANPADNNLSFYSGHSSFAFSLATASGTIATLRGYDYAPLIWGVGLSAAVATGYLRIAADKHYASDVITGALIGSAVGIIIPLLHRGDSTASADITQPSLSANPLSGGGLLTLSGRF